VKRRFQIVITQPSRSEAGNGAPLTRFGRFKTLLAGLALVTVALAVLIAALILGYIIAALASIVVIGVIAVLFVNSLFRRRRTVMNPLRRG
jgi:hypothetical protein